MYSTGRWSWHPLSGCLAALSFSKGHSGSTISPLALPSPLLLLSRPLSRPDTLCGLEGQVVGQAAGVAARAALWLHLFNPIRLPGWIGGCDGGGRFVRELDSCVCTSVGLVVSRVENVVVSRILRFGFGPDLPACSCLGSSMDSACCESSICHMCVLALAACCQAMVERRVRTCQRAWGCWGGGGGTLPSTPQLEGGQGPSHHMLVPITPAVFWVGQAFLRDPRTQRRTTGGCFHEKPHRVRP